MFEYNVFYGEHHFSEPEDPHKITDNPMFINPGSGNVGSAGLGGYMLKSGSPSISSGVTIPGHAERDYFGNPVPFDDTKVDRGAFEFQGK